MCQLTLLTRGRILYSKLGVSSRIMCGKATLLYLTAQIGYLFIVFLSLERFPQKKNHLIIIEVVIYCLFLK
jgi:hypothetical protein